MVKVERINFLGNVVEEEVPNGTMTFVADSGVLCVGRKLGIEKLWFRHYSAGSWVSSEIVES